MLYLIIWGHIYEHDLLNSVIASDLECKLAMFGFTAYHVHLDGHFPGEQKPGLVQSHQCSSATCSGREHLRTNGLLVIQRTLSKH